MVVGFVIERARSEKSSDGGSDFWSVAIPGLLTGVGTLALALATVLLARTDRSRSDEQRREDLQRADEQRRQDVERDNDLRRQERERDKRERQNLAAENRASLLRVQLINPGLDETLSDSLDRIILENLSSETFYDVKYFYSVSGQTVSFDAGEIAPSGSYHAGIGARDSVRGLRVEFTDVNERVWSRALDGPLLEKTAPQNGAYEDSITSITRLKAPRKQEDE